MRTNSSESKIQLLYEFGIFSTIYTAPALKQKGEGGSELFPHVRVRANLQGLVLHMKMLEKERLHRCLN
ncbi:hypothetical protein L2E82_29785 [Cichorium intybus]|uniref:Uncharacterized protein n=1 Tax=Cichorium intybus TaxID=13427 RepID=A0ACB9CYQ2_CICIN|nr:hypothetical protein L2E82_29785 [Cichorium intybus]